MMINDPATLSEMHSAFTRYEDALVNNKVEVLDELFWKSPLTIRYGIAENLYGFDQIAAFRAARSPVGLARRLMNTVITTYGHDFATANTEFARENADKIGRQSQTWMRMPEGWRIVSAHVSLIPKT